MDPEHEEASRHERVHALREDQEAEVMQALRQYAAQAARVREELGEEVADPGEAALLVDRIEAALAGPSAIERTKNGRPPSPM
ncbi:MAG TPA: hypothetical protein VH877_17825 [Polyangia bacterium]|jgi:hypothetical protein|nr:hypothetical protein [Polyangia bacterium]